MSSVIPLPIIKPVKILSEITPLTKPKKTANAMTAVTPKAMAIQVNTLTKGDTPTRSLA
jgi:hypothetical protein